ncbi:structural maintenance of chromosomes protein 4 [Fopius arisanus]|uniref:Structural maintenance of chromosomes protein n=1 Tax=Fopius arisanus TaxID=64838 RepID=A0A9R1U6L6_9HYME|nr:PREDICTED: structural maintenance of chromosomes protein 4 [Fopius arisanus]XP_011309308.1 PREDICTED: structural maintenance of chromosomes protein 4 [Fopius arisanus]XP_011309309.1 PREDICTED: structural maintenance of chromosomes protein 4 [Fopius arisanus]
MPSPADVSPMEIDENHYDSDEEGGVRIDEDIYIPPPPQKLTEHNSSDPRLIISKITNRDFKSYAGTVDIGPFNTCFSSIVGPNGSGKSNVIDSMLFVFGYRATKIRSKKVSSMIHSSNEHPNCTSCTVSVYFRKVLDKPNEEYEEIPGSEIIISRTAFKDSSSYYELNGRKVQFKEIAKLLRHEGVDLDHNRFLILQGEVEQIALMKPKGQSDTDTGMLEFLEDIIGTTRYKQPLEKLATKVEILSERVVERTNRLRMAEKERDTLKEPMQEAVAYLKIENAITKLQHKLYHCKRVDTMGEIKEKEEFHEGLGKDLKDLKSEMSRVHEDKEEKSRELKEKSKKWDAIQLKRDAASGRFEEIRKKDEALHAEALETNKRRKLNMQSVKTEQMNLENLSRIPEKNAEEIEECETLIQRHITKKEKEEEQLQVLMGSLKEKTEPLMKRRAEMEKKLIVYKKNVNEAKGIFDLAQSELEIYTSVEVKEREKLERLKETLQRAAETLKDRREQLETLKKKIPKTEKSLNDARRDLAEAKAQELEAATNLKRMRLQFEEQRSAMNASKSRSAVLDFLMQQKREGKLAGVIGRLGDLGAVDAKYDIAVSTACGTLDHIVVDTVDTAQECIELLRRHNVGRANFIPLEKQQHLVEIYQEPVKTPENVVRLFDVIKVEDQRILPAFYFGLRNTLLAVDLEQGSRIAYGAQRWRVVTVQGQLIETSGTMSGGGRPSKGRIGQRVMRNEPSGADIERLQGDLESIYEECNRLRMKQPPLEEQIRVLSSALEEMILNRDKFEIEAQTIQEQAPSLKQQVKAQEKKVIESKSSAERVEELAEAVERSREKLEKTKKESESTDRAVKEINDEIEELSGGKVKEQQKKISDLSKGIDKARKEICRLQVGIKTSERDSRKTSQRIEQLEADIQICQGRLTEIHQEIHECEEEAKTILEEIKVHDTALVERDAAAASLKGDIHKLQDRENKMKATKIDLDEKFKASENVIAELRLKVAKYERGIKGLKLTDIPDEPQEELPDYTDEQISNFDTRTVANNLAAAQEKLPQETPNMQTIKDYLEKDKVFMKRSAEVHEATDVRNKMRSAYDEARKRRAEEFHAGFNVITTKLKEMYQMITLGGAAELELVDSLDPFTEGITFSVRPPRKSWKNISNLSGGEKTLSSLALVFALHHYKPTPLYFMDEIDAALDFKNVSIVGRYIKDRTKNAQFIVISLRSEMFELADTLIGIFKTFNGTKSIPVDIKGIYAAHPKIEEVEKAKMAVRNLKVARNSLSQVVRHEAISQPRMPLTCPPIIENFDELEARDDPRDDLQESRARVSPVTVPPGPVHRRSLGGDTPITTRRSLKDINSQI